MKIPEDALFAQRKATNPEINVWVSANAGSGKTHVLTERVLRLLLAGNDPTRILCLTYTTAASSVMQRRIFARLLDWSRSPREKLYSNLENLMGQSPTTLQLERARELFALVLESPGGLKVQTIHSFCQMVLAQYPLEADMPGYFRLDEKECKRLFERLQIDFFEELETKADTELANNLDLIIKNIGASGFIKILETVFEKLSFFPLRYTEEEWNTFQVFLGLNTQDSEESVFLQCKSFLNAFEKSDLFKILKERGGKNSQKFTLEVNELRFCKMEEMLQKLKLFLYTKTPPIKLKKTSTIIIKNIWSAYPQANLEFNNLRDGLIACFNKLKAFELLNINRAIFKVLETFFLRYNAYKKKLSILNYDDLISKTLHLLKRCDVEWVHLKLDRGIDHILVDEAQDTDVQQWEIIRRLSAPFFSGESEKNKRRTIFAVGDEKQSIYSFRGANPIEFAKNREFFKEKSKQIKQKFENIRLDYSFRSASSILSAVDEVFSDPKIYYGLSHENCPTVHRVIRNQICGEVEIWSTETEEKVEVDMDWCSRASISESLESRLAKRIVDKICGWLDSKKRLPEKNRIIKPQDILILLRKRTKMAVPILRELDAHNVPTMGEDSLHLLEHIAVQDLIALGSFVLQPLDDLSLACVLKSPLFEVTEKQLFELAYSRSKGSSLYKNLQAKAQECSFLGSILKKLQIYRNMADTVSVFEFYSRVLNQDGGRKKYRAHLGEQVLEILDLFLKSALDYEDEPLYSLQLFLEKLKKDNPKIKRELNQTGEGVRVMTIHGAKGLEAPIVFVVDENRSNNNDSKKPYFLSIKNGTDTIETEKDLYFWFGECAGVLKSVQDLYDTYRRFTEEEYIRTLYVAMTRAEDILIVCGYKKQKTSIFKSWLEMVDEPFKDKLIVEKRDSDGKILVQKFISQPAYDVNNQLPMTKINDVEIEGVVGEWDDHQKMEAMDQLPLFLKEKMPIEKNTLYTGTSILVQIAPERSNEAIQEKGSPILDEEIENSRFMIERGILIHRLLQYLPQLDSTFRKEKALHYLEVHTKSWTHVQQQEAIDCVLNLINNPEFSFLFSKNSQAEVPIMGHLCVNGEKKLLSGVVDRLIVTGSHVIVVDYKTGKQPLDPFGIPEHHLQQLSLYAKMLKAMYDKKKISCFLIYTQGPVFYSFDYDDNEKLVFKTEEVLL